MQEFVYHTVSRKKETFEKQQSCSMEVLRQCGVHPSILPPAEGSIHLLTLPTRLSSMRASLAGLLSPLAQ